MSTTDDCASGDGQYVNAEELLEAWKANFERLMDGRWPEDDVALDWDTTDDEAILRIEEPPENTTMIDRPGSRTQRSIWLYFDRGVDAAQESLRLVSSQENPMGSGDAKHSAMLAVPVADNRNTR